jgi:3',5'-cyclic AMP phosphodiesterase CpdA
LLHFPLVPFRLPLRMLSVNLKSVKMPGMGAGTTQASGAPAFRFAHLSDPHLATLDAVGWRQLANKRLLGWLSWNLRRRRLHRRDVLELIVSDLRAQAPDHTVVTGDLTQIGTPDECRQALAWLKSLGGAADVTVIPGNHDRYIAAPWLDGPGSWRDFMRDESGSQPGAEVAPVFPFVRQRGHVAFIGLNSAVPTPPFLASGRLGAAQLDAMGPELARLRRAGRFRVLLIHHGPLPLLYSRRRGLDDAARFAAELARHGAELVLHGHGHERHRHTIPGPGGDIPVIGVSSASAAYAATERRAAYNLYTVRTAGSGWTLDVQERRADFDTMTVQNGDAWRVELPHSRAAAGNGD